MARQRKPDLASPAEPARLNSPQGDELIGLIREVADRVDELNASIRTSAAAHAAFAKGQRELKAAVYAEGKERGVPVDLLKRAIKARDLAHRANEQSAGLDLDELPQFKTCREALGDFADLPLGAAAMNAAGEKPAPKASGTKPERGGSVRKPSSAAKGASVGKTDAAAIDPDAVAKAKAFDSKLAGKHEADAASEGGGKPLKDPWEDDAEAETEKFMDRTHAQRAADDGAAA